MTLVRWAAEALFRLALLAFPRRFRADHGRELRDDFGRLLVRAGRERGAGAVVGVAVRASWDAWRQGWWERGRRGVPAGHGQARRESTGGGEGVMTGIWNDVRWAVRSVSRAPGFTLAAVLVLGLGIGANTTVFSALRAAILTEPPFPELDRLVFADLTRTPDGAATEPSSWSYPKFQVFLDAPDRLIDPVAGYAVRYVTLSEAGPPTRVATEVVTPGYFEVLGMTPRPGRGFTAEDDRAGGASLVTVVSHSLWRGRLSGDPDILGRDIVLNGLPLTVVGVAPEGFRGLTGDAELWIPAQASGQLISTFMTRASQAHWLRAVGRLRPGATFEDARAQMTALGTAVAEAYPSDPEYSVSYGGTARRFEDVRVNREGRAAVVLLSVAAALVLLVACANLSGLLLARARRRARDGAVRLAVGASRWRLVRASLVESTLLAALGGGVGLLLSIWGTGAMAAAWPQQFLSSGDGELRVMSLDAIGIDATVLAFGFGATLLTALLFGVAPALRGSRDDLAARLKDGGGGSRRSDRLLGIDLRIVLVGGQVALAVALLVGTGLVGVSMQRLLTVDLGFRAEGVLTFDYTLARESAWTRDPIGFQEAFMERVGALPGVEAVALGGPPLRGHWSITTVKDIEGQPAISAGEGPAIGIHIVSPDYFDVLGIPLLRGRVFDRTDGRDSVPTVILNETGARALFPDGSPVGRRLELGISDDGKARLAEVVGVVADVRYSPPDEELIPEAYYAAREFPLGGGGVLVRVDGDPMAVLPAIRAALQELDAPTPLSSPRTMEQRVADATGDRRVVAALMALFSAVTLLLAATGTWGVVSYAVADRRRELGLRIALGAGAGRVLRTVVGASVGAGAVGLVAGLAVAWVGSRLLDAFLYQTSARDPLAFAGGALLLMAVVGLASYLPARRAMRVDPVEALKAE